MNNSEPFSIILPVYNEDVSLTIMVNILEATIDFPHEVIIVYDEENDTSVKPARELMKLYSNIILVHNDLGRGAKNAVIKGVEESKYDIFLITVVDEVIPIVAIKNMLRLISEKNCDFVSGTRYALGGKRYGGSFIGGLLSRTANYLFGCITGLVLTDATTGFKMMRKSAWRKLSIESNPVGWAFSFELSIKAQLIGLKLGEVPVISIDRLFGGQSTFRLGPWVKEYFRWFFWGTINLNRFNRNQVRVATLNSK